MAAMELKADADKKGRQDGGPNGGDKAAKAERPFDLTAPEWYLNRELTWLEFNRRMRDCRGDVGIWHETYLVRAGEYEAIASGMPPQGLFAIGDLLPATGHRSSAANRLRVRV